MLFHFKNPYKLRLKGLSKKLDNDELATILLHLAKRRGSSLEVVEEDSTSNGELSTKAILSKNEALLKDNNYVVNVQLDRFKENQQIRGTNNVFKTEDYLNELKEILKHQNLGEELNKQIISIISRRRHFSEGPGSINSPTKYGRFREVEGETLQEIKKYLNREYQNKYLKEKFNFKFENKEYVAFKDGRITNAKPYDLIALMRGYCSIYPEEVRAPKMAFSAELFNLLNDLNNLKISNRISEKITNEEKEAIISQVRKTGNLTVNNVLKYLNADILEVSGFRLDKNEKPQISEFKGYKKLLKIFKKLDLEMLEDKKLDQVMEVLTETVIEEERFEKINKIVGNKILAQELSILTGVNEYHSLSLKAIYELNEEMLNTSLNQMEIITKSGLRKPKQIKKLSLDETAILSPVAKRAHREALKVVEELINEYGNFDRIIIETTRDKNSADQRRRIREIQKYFENSRKEAEEVLGDYAQNYINQANILKIRLYKEQDGKCAYTGKPIDLLTLIKDPYAYEIDHIIPLSISLDDSYNNKVLVYPSANQAKGNNTPFKYFQSGYKIKDNPISSWEQFETIVNNNKNYSRLKKQNLLFLKDITKYSTIQEFVNRNFVDTSYATRSLMTTLKNYFQSNEVDTKVFTIKGKQTNLFRKIGRSIWNYKYPNNDFNPFVKDRDKYIHHAIDALIIAGLSNQRHLRKLYELDFDENEEYYISRKTGEVFDGLNNDEITKYLLKVSKIKDEDVNYSWKIDTKPNRSLSDQTIYSTRIKDKEHHVVKKLDNIYELDDKKLKTYFEGKNREKLLVYQHDKKTFEKLEKAYLQYSHEKYPFQAFYEDHGYLTKYAKKNNGPIIKSLKYLDKRLGNHLDITPGSAKDKKVVKLQVSPYRTDIYYNKELNNYKFVTVRYSDMLEQNKKYVINKKWYENEKLNKKINSDYEFKFSLYRNNVLGIHKQEKDHLIKTIARFVATKNDKTNVIELKSINKYDSNRLVETIGRKTIKINKYNVSVTGKVSKVTKERLKLII